MCTDVQLDLLKSAKCWFADRFFKVVQKPFVQLWSIHAFIKQDVKQVPLVCVLMSRRQKADYIGVLNSLLELTGSNFPDEEVILDFEQAEWSAFRAVFFDRVQCRGCTFHWTQAVFRKLKSLGLVPAYYRKRNTRKFLRQLMCFSLWPAEEIELTF